MKKLSLTDITLLVVAVCLILILLPVLIRLRRSTTIEKNARVPHGVTTTTLPVAAPDTGSNAVSPSAAEAADEEKAKEEKIPRPADGKKPILMY